MCEYCNCQAIPAIATLTEEHDDALDHVRAATAAIHSGDARQLQDSCSQLAALLGPHTAVEEQALFPAMRADFPDQIRDLYRDHEVIDSALAEATSAGDRSAGWEQRLEAALRRLREHIHKEQDGVFPAALSTLTTAQWEQLELVRERVAAGHPAAPGGPENVRA